MNPCTLCARNNLGGAVICVHCGVRLMEDLEFLDPNTREMWHAHMRVQLSIRKIVLALLWVVLAFAALSLAGGFVWYSKVANGTIGGF